MNARNTVIGRLILTVAMIAFVVGSASAHCDSEDGPIIPSIRKALDDGNITPLMKWIASEDEEEISTLFTRVRDVRTESDEARQVADRLFIETFIRLHRASEGAPYTGIKPAGSVPPIFAAADEALESGSVDELSDKVSTAVRERITEQYNRAMTLRKYQDESVAAGREYVEAYVAYLHFVEGLHAYLESAGTGRSHDSEPAHEH